jgi:Ca2+-transporting ATPase
MVAATLSSFVLMLAVIYLPVFEPIFYTHNLSLQDWLLVLPLTLIPSIVAETSKWVASHRTQRPAAAQLVQ